MAHLWSDVRLAWRANRRTPAFTFVALLSLALGTGANTAVFTLVDQVLLRPLPVNDPHELVQLTNRGMKHGNSIGDGSELSHPMYAALRDHNAVFSGLFSRFAVAVNIGVEGRTERLPGDLVSGTFFPVLGVGARLGRVLTPDDDRTPGGHSVAVISHAWWQRRFNGDPAIVGRPLVVNGLPFTIVGVAQEGFRGVAVGAPRDIYLPVAMQHAIMRGAPVLDDPRFYWVRVFGRLKPGVSAAQAAASLQPFYRAQLAAEAELPALATIAPQARQRFLASQIEVTPSPRGQSGFRGQVLRPFTVLMALVVGLLLIVCANVANLLLARGAGRQREIAIRLALGAARRRLVQQLFVESVLLAIAGGALGLLVATWATPALLAFFVNPDEPLPIATSPDWRILAFTFGLTTIVSLLCGLGPALQSSRPSVAPTLQAHAGAVLGGHSARLRKLLVVTQVAVCLLLIAGATAFVRTLDNLLATDLGVRTENLIAFAVDPPPARQSPLQVKQFAKDVIARVQRTPGVTAAALSGERLLTGAVWRGGLALDGDQPPPGTDVSALGHTVGPDFFATMGMRLVAGRTFTDRDEHTDPPLANFRMSGFHVAIVNERFVKEYLGSPTAALGRHLGFGAQHLKNRPFEIVGVVSDAKYGGVREDHQPQIYFPYLEQAEPAGFTVYARTVGDPTQTFALIRDAAQQVDATAPVFAMRTVTREVSGALTNERFMATISGALASLAALLAVIGLYGVMAHVVARRTREIGIRLALGAKRADIGRLVMRDVFAMTGTGLAIGLPLVWWLGRYISNQLYGVRPTDPLTLLVVIGGLVLVAVLGGLLPSLRAMRMAPTTALRYE